MSALSKTMGLHHPHQARGPSIFAFPDAAPPREGRRALTDKARSGAVATWSDPPISSRRARIPRRPCPALSPT